MPGRLRRFLLGWSVLLAGCATGVEDAQFDNPFDPDNAGSFPVPDSIRVTVGNNAVHLAWTIEPGSGALEYAVFRRRVDVLPPEEEEYIAKVTALTYEDHQVRNGRIYQYRIAAGAGGRFGERSESVEARPAFFSIVLAADAPHTRFTTVTVTATAPSGVEAVQLANSPDFAGATWRPVTGAVSWVLTGGDGQKIVYARFRLSDGSESIPVSDVILLDTRAVVREVDFLGAETRAPGEILHFRLDSGEAGGSAWVTVDDLLSEVTLSDDGVGGDAQAGDGVYEGDVLIPGGVTVNRATVTGQFTDAAGNEASPLVGPRTLTVAEAPEAVTILSTELALPPDAPSVTLRWTQSFESDFRSYRIFRSADPVVDDADPLAGEVSASGTLFLRDTDVVEGRTYYYSVFVRNTIGLETGSATSSVTVPNVRPPQAVTLQTPDGVSDSRISLSWTRSPDLDFAAYRVYRNETGSVGDTDFLVIEITNPDLTYHDDSGLIDNTAYHYRVFTVDDAGLTGRSNEIEATTSNLPPPPVTLAEATNVTSTAATLQWAQSDVHDFASYRLYRDTVPSVTAASTLVAERLERDATAYRDANLATGRTYYFRLYVVDDGEIPGPKQSGSNIVAVTTP